jgi:hypothetical protein
MHIMLGTCVPNLRGRGGVEHTQMYLALKKGTKTSIILAILVEFFVISLFHETKIPMVDMEIQVYSNLAKNNSKKIKSPSSMRNGRFYTPKYRGNFQEMEVLYTRPGAPPRSYMPLKKLRKK